MKTVAVIPARYGSTRFEGKPLAAILNKPMILWVAERVSKAQRVDEVIVATDDERIQKVVVKAGYQVVMTPSDLPSGTDRVFAALGDKWAESLVINVQGDEPLINPELIDRLVLLMEQNPECEMGTLAAPLLLEDLANKNVVKLVLDKKGRAIYFSRLGIPYTRQQFKPEGLAFRHLGIYAYRANFLKQFCSTPASLLEEAEGLEQLRALYLGAKIQVGVTDSAGHSVDTPGDIQVVEELIKNRFSEQS